MSLKTDKLLIEVEKLDTDTNNLTTKKMLSFLGAVTIPSESLSISITDLDDILRTVLLNKRQNNNAQMELKIITKKKEAYLKAMLINTADPNTIEILLGKKKDYKKYCRKAWIYNPFLIKNVKLAYTKMIPTDKTKIKVHLLSDDPRIVLTHSDHDVIGVAMGFGAKND